MDWIKLEKSTPDKPEILEMAEFLEIDPDAVMGKMIRVWSWLDSNSENGHTSNVTSVLIKRITCHNKFPDAMIHVGWLEKTDSGYSIPHYDRHLGKSSKKRALDAERQRKSRDSSQNSHDQGVTKALPEKRREDKSNTSAQVENKFSTDDMKLAEFIYSKVLNVLPKAKKPNLNKWADDIRLMRESDKHTHREIQTVFLFANSDDFWKVNIASPGKLRKKFADLHGRMIQKPGSNFSLDEDRSIEI